MKRFTIAIALIATLLITWQPESSRADGVDLSKIFPPNYDWSEWGSSGPPADFDIDLDFHTLLTDSGWGGDFGDGWNDGWNDGWDDGWDDWWSDGRDDEWENWWHDCWDDSWNPPTVNVPEPSSVALVSLGAIGLISRRRRRR